MIGAKVRLLVLSSIPGRYALGEANERPLTSGDAIEILAGGRWLRAHVEHSMAEHRGAYAQEDATGDASFIYGYYAIAVTGEICGLCTGMAVRFPQQPKKRPAKGGNR